jgi:hypothetical protein
VVSTPSGLFDMARQADGSFTTLPHPLDSRFAGKPMRSIARSGSQLWFDCGRELCVEERGRVSIFGPAEGLPEDAWDAITITPDGSVWIRSPSLLYRKPPGEARVIRERPELASSIYFGALGQGRDGSIMVPTDEGLAVRRGGNWTVVDDRRGLRTAVTTAVLEDRDGSLWVALVGAGVARWIGHGEWEAWTKAQGLPSDLIWSIRRDRKGALWVGTSLGLARLDLTRPDDPPRRGPRRTAWAETTCDGWARRRWRHLGGGETWRRSAHRAGNRKDPQVRHR